MEVLVNDTADSAGQTVTNAEVDVKTINIRENSFPLLRMECDVSISTTGTSLAQAVTFRLRLGGLVKTYVYTSKAAIDNDYMRMMFQARQNDKAAAIRLTVQGAGTDAQTSVLCKGFYVYGMQHSLLQG
jgi:hypothetical protein